MEFGQINIRVTPRASKNAIEGFRGDALIVRVTAPPVDSAANDAVIELIAKRLQIAKRDVAITRGVTARNKTVKVAGFSSAGLKSRLEK